jgi:DNA modification methylase
MLAFALRADGWYLRQDIIWAKPNPDARECHRPLHEGARVRFPAFAGSGTTLLVARDLGCYGLGIELNPAYIEMAHRRLAQSVLFTPEPYPAADTSRTSDTSTCVHEQLALPDSERMEPASESLT